MQLNNLNQLRKITSFGFAALGTWLISATNANAVIFSLH